MWDAWGDSYPELLSPENLRAIAQGRSPIVVDAWIESFPEDAGLKGEVILLHHVDGYPMVAPLPLTNHYDAHQPGGTRKNRGANFGSPFPFYPAKPDD